jgi:hypothetical protein
MDEPDVQQLIKELAARAQQEAIREMAAMKAKGGR